VARTRSTKSGADHNVMRELNRSLVLDLIKQGSPISRAAIAKATDLAKPTVSAIVDELVRDGLVREIGMGQPTRGGGRPPVLLEFNTRSQFVVGVQIGVRGTTIVVADAAGEEVGRLQRPTVKRKASEALERLAEHIVRAVDQSGIARKRLAAVGVCVPGLVDADTGVCLLAPNLGWRNVDVRGALTAALKVPVFVHNTAQAVAVAENLEGAGQGASDLVLLYVGSGIGAGIVSDGRLFHGAAGIAGEIGHCQIPGATEPCNCGKKGCLETVASGPNIVKEAKRALLKRKASSLAKVPEADITPEKIAEAANQGDALATELLADAGRQLGTAASWLINLMNPEVLVVAGGLTEAGEALLEPLRQTVAERTLPQSVASVEIKMSALGQDAEVRGAVLLALQSSESYYRVVFQG
jgi:glucokinase-like ROK family protein